MNDGRKNVIRTTSIVTKTKHMIIEYNAEVREHEELEEEERFEDESDLSGEVQANSTEMDWSGPRSPPLSAPGGASTDLNTVAKGNTNAKVSEAKVG